MTVVRGRPPVSRAASRDRRALWPVAACTACMPLAYLLGLGAVVWIAPAFALGVLALRRRDLRVPWSVLPIAALALWIPATSVSLSGAGSFTVFLYRWSLWIALIGAMVWLVNTPNRRVPTARVVDLLAALWIVFVAFGYLALLLPDVAVASPFGRLLPASIATNVFVSDLTIIRFAELQRFVGGVVPRPAAPMIATNGWGSTFAILTPFFVLSWLLVDDRRRRRIGWLLVVVAVPPFAVSTNRGAWLSLAVGLVYVAVRLALRGATRTLAATVACGVLAIVVVALTPLGSTVRTRLDGASASNDTRESLYVQAWDRALDSPFVGYGEPIPNPPDPPIGTHGLVWYAMVAHGFPGLGLVLGIFAALLASTFRYRTRTGLWCHAAIVICALQSPFYGLLPQIVIVGFAAGICWRDVHPEAASGG